MSWPGARCADLSRAGSHFYQARRWNDGSPPPQPLRCPGVRLCLCACERGCVGEIGCVRGSVDPGLRPRVALSCSHHPCIPLTSRPPSLSLPLPLSPSSPPSPLWRSAVPPSLPAYFPLSPSLTRIRTPTHMHTHVCARYGSCRGAARVSRTPSCATTRQPRLSLLLRCDASHSRALGSLSLLFLSPPLTP
jgi:hypothetical protein